MLPWFWNWSPQFNFPLSGSVLQDIEPDLGWFFGNIKPESGVGSIEKEAFDVASYGRQLGLILEVLLPLAEEGTPKSPKAQTALADLKAIYASIENIKATRKSEMEATAVDLLKQIANADAAMLQRVLNQFQPQPRLLTDQSTN